MCINLTWNCNLYRSDFSLFSVRVLAKPYQFGVNWPTTLCENKDGVHFFALKFEWHNRYSKLLLCNSEYGDIAWCNKNNSERGILYILHDAIKTIQKGDKNKNPCLLKKKQKIRFKKTCGLFFSKQRVFLNPDCLSILFGIFPWSNDLEQWCSIKSECCDKC